MKTLPRVIVLASLLIAAMVSAHRLHPLASSMTMRDQYRPWYLHVEGPRLVAANGTQVRLHGVNLGGWLVTEDWMCGFRDQKDAMQDRVHPGMEGRSAAESLKNRFGAATADMLMNTWHDNWITTADLDRISDGGFNLIRVPISYRTLQRDDGQWRRGTDGRIDFSRMDWVVREAARRGIYTIFDLHVWRDQAQAFDRIGRPEGGAVRRATARFWAVIADHYRGNGAIAGFDLINEFPGNWGVQQDLSRGIALGDPARVQIVEGYTIRQFLALRSAGRFPNSVFSEHFYGSAPLATAEIASRLKELRGSPAPVYVGEFLPADFASATQAMTTAGVNWSSWTYKTVDMGDWGIFSYNADMRTDLQHDSLESIRRKWSTQLTAWQRPDAERDWYVNGDRTPR